MAADVPPVYVPPLPPLDSIVRAAEENTAAEERNRPKYVVPAPGTSQPR